MSYSVILLPQAKADMIAIFRYIEYDLQSVQNAKAQLARLESEINSLTEMPERFRAYKSKKWCGRNLRVMTVDNYLVFYIPDHKENMVTVIRVLYGRCDIDRQLESL